MTEQPSSCCCDMMQSNLAFDCTAHDSIYDCADSLVVYIKKFQEYGLIIHDGGSSFIVIQHCPWCGIDLPASTRNEYFDKLEAKTS